MAELEQAFRTAVFGGFNRQDVLQYIESESKRMGERLEALQKELDVRTGAEEKAAALSKENARLSAELSAQTAVLTQTQDDCRTLREEQDALRAKAEQLECAATAYAALKDRAGTIELEAHQRANLIEQKAVAKAKRLHDDAEGLLLKVQTSYHRLRGDVDVTLVHAAAELSRAEKTLADVKTELTQHDAELQRLLATSHAYEAVKTPQPLKLTSEE